jgi:hypothetical protein
MSTQTEESGAAAKRPRLNTGEGPNGAYVRFDSKHRPKLDEIEVESGRYHLHVALACPWAAGTLSMLKLKGLDEAVTHSVVHPTWQATRPDDEGDTHCGPLHTFLLFPRRDELAAVFRMNPTGLRCLPQTPF